MTTREGGGDDEKAGLGHHERVAGTPPKVAVVGAGGFIGSALVRRLVADGEAVGQFTRDNPFVAPDGGIADDATSVETVIWLVGSTNPAVAEERNDLVLADENALNTMLHAVAQLEIPPRVVLVSSGGTVYDAMGEPPYAEDSAVRPATAYGKAKVRLEAAVQAGASESTIVRVANAYGPGQRVGRGQGVIAHWLHAAAHRKPLVLIGDPETARDFVFVDDLVDALVRVHHASSPPPVMNIGAGHPTTLGELRRIILDVIGLPAAFVAEPARGFDTSRTWLDIRLAEKTLGWRPTTTLAEGVARTWFALTAERGGVVAEQGADQTVVPLP